MSLEKLKHIVSNFNVSMVEPNLMNTWSNYLNFFPNQKRDFISITYLNFYEGQVNIVVNHDYRIRNVM